MRIKSIQIRGFGMLSHRKIDFAEPFLLFYGENESGKTTVLQFIRMMLYGSGGNLRTRYRPLSGDEMGGSMLFEQDGTEYQLDRSFGKSKSSDITVLTDLNTGKTQKLASNRQPGEILLKINEDTFIRSCFVGSPGSIAGEKGSEEIRSKLQNLISTGTEEISASTVEKRLNDAAKLLQNRSETGGAITRCEKELERLLQGQAESIRIESEYALQIQKRETLEQRIQVLQQYLTASQQEKDESAKDSLKMQIGALETQLTVDGEVTSRAALTELRGELHALIEQTRQIQTENPLQNDPSYQAAQAHHTASLRCEQEAKDRCIHARQTADAVSKQQPLLYLWLVIGALFLILGCILFSVSTVFAAILCGVSLAALCASVVQWLMGRRKVKQANAALFQADDALKNAQDAVEQSQQQLQALEKELCRIQSDRNAALDRLHSRVYRSLRKYGISESEQAPAALESLIATHDRYTEAKLRLLALEQNLTPEQIAAEKELRRLQLESATLSGILQTMPKPRSSAQIEQEITLTRQKLSALKNRLRAVQLASKILSESFEEMQKQFGGILSLETERFLRLLTDGKYDRAAIDRSLNLQARQQISGRMTADVYLSAGTADQCYLALRLAIAKLIAAQNKVSLPLFFDDSMIQYDDRRMESAMRLIGSLTETKEFSQAVFFTCHKREAECYQKYKSE